MSICTCPVGTAIPSVPNSSCPVDFGQIQKIVFQRIFKSGTTKNAFDSTDKITVLASWTDCFSASDGTKMVITPFVSAPAADGGDAIVFGGGNETPGGVQEIIGRNPVNMTFALRRVAQSIVKALKGLECEELGVYFLNGDNQILAKKGATEDDFSPIPVKSLFVGDLMLNGFETPDSNALSFSLLPNWSDDVEIVSVDWNPLTDLANA